MAVSVLDLFSIGIGPSSSHTVGPMRAAAIFAQELVDLGLAEQRPRIRCELYGSLAATGIGHGTDRAVMLGLEGHRPETVEPQFASEIRDRVAISGTINLLGRYPISFPDNAICMRRGRMAFHPNGMRFTATAADGRHLCREFYSVGGGFLMPAPGTELPPGSAPTPIDPVYPFSTSEQLLKQCHETGLTVSELVLANELTARTSEDIAEAVALRWSTMKTCIERGCRAEGELPGGLRVPRRAAEMWRTLLTREEAPGRDGLTSMEWINLYALAVNEENAAGGRVVTAPTNGAAGVVPAVLKYFTDHVASDHPAQVMRFFLTAGAIGLLFKENASISGAEVGCQGEIGAACSMAAAGLCEVTGGTPRQVENAAEIALEHHLGLTCDPVGGLVQIPCIERNAIAAVTAVNAARMARLGSGAHLVSLDRAIETMRATGHDMKTKYKETGQGGLGVHIIEC